MPGKCPKYYVDNETRWMCRIVSPYSNLSELNPEEFNNEVTPHLLFEKLKRHRLYPVFYQKWRDWNSRPTESKWQQFELSLKQLAGKNQLMMMQKTAELLRIIKSFEEAGIPVISLKGPVLARQLYGNIALKASIDLDILINEKDFDRAWDCLYSIGYVCPDSEKGFTPKQKRYLIKNFHHLGFINKNQNVPVELHWMLNTNRYLLEYPFERLYEKSAFIDIEGIKVRTLNTLDQTVHLMVHGAYHQWARLDWLLDWTVLMEKFNDEEGFEEEVRRNGLNLIARETLYLREFFFRNDGIINPKPDFKLVNRAILASQKNYQKILEQKIMQKLYLLKLKPGTRYKTRVFSVLGTNKGDWAILRLPDSLFFLYYVLRPVLYAIRILKSNS